jgi:hypothetical protein
LASGKKPPGVGIENGVDQVAHIAVNPAISREQIHVNVTGIERILHLEMKSMNMGFPKLDL